MEHSSLGFILCLNGGSSNFKFATYSIGDKLQIRSCLRGEVSQAGSKSSELRITKNPNSSSRLVKKEPLRAIFYFLEEQGALPKIQAIGHRIVHGGQHYRDPILLNTPVIERLYERVSIDPEHLPQELEAIEQVKELLPGTPQIACFDTGFHQSLPRMAQLYAIPKWFEKKGFIRYGFHGLSCESILNSLSNEGITPKQYGKLVIAHLGGGSSLTAIENGESRETTMGFSPCEGLPMSTRSGSLDPVMILELMERQKLSVPQMKELLNKRSGLLGLSGVSSDMETLLSKADQNLNAREALEFYCYQVSKQVAAMAAAIHGINTLIFCGGIGENAALIRSRICENLNFIGIKINSDLNLKSAAIISEGPVKIRVIKSDEESVIAQHTFQILKKFQKNNSQLKGIKI